MIALPARLVWDSRGPGLLRICCFSLMGFGFRGEWWVCFLFTVSRLPCFKMMWEEILVGRLVDVVSATRIRTHTHIQNTHAS